MCRRKGSEKKFRRKKKQRKVTSSSFSFLSLPGGEGSKLIKLMTPQGEVSSLSSYLGLP